MNLPGNRRAAAALVNEQVEVRWADLTVTDQVESLVNEVRPGAIIHLAAIIPPAAYRRPRLARAVMSMPLRRC